MTISEEIQPLSDKPARHCKICGARVSDTAQTCLICGADLSVQQETIPEDQTHQKTLPILRIFILFLITIIILAGSVIIGLELGERANTNEIPTFTPTVTITPTPTPSPTIQPTSTATPIIPTDTPQPPETYLVKEGDTISGIAEDYGLSVAEILAYNELSETDLIVIGQTLLIPLASPTPGPSPTLRPGEPTATRSPYILHTVVGGDSLSSIAEKYNVSISTIKVANDIPEDSDAIQLGQVLTIPQQTPTPEHEPDVIYTVTPTPGVITYEAPLLLYPPDQTLFSGSETSITLQWLSAGILDDREYYNLEVIIATEEAKTTYNVYLRSTAWTIPVEWIPDDAAQLNCSWRVHIVRQVTQSVENNYKIISSTVARRTFTWQLHE